jgi:hypothetical protein
MTHTFFKILLFLVIGLGLLIVFQQPSYACVSCVDNCCGGSGNPPPAPSIAPTKPVLKVSVVPRITAGAEAAADRAESITPAIKSTISTLMAPLFQVRPATGSQKTLFVSNGGNIRTNPVLAKPLMAMEEIPAAR